MSDSIDDHLPLSPLRFLILLAIISGDDYGYRIARSVRERSEERIDMLPGNLYSVLQRLERDGLIERSGRREVGEQGGAPRSYFGITELGREAVVAEAERMRRLVDGGDVRALLSEASS